MESLTDIFVSEGAVHIKAPFPHFRSDISDKAHKECLRTPGILSDTYVHDVGTQGADQGRPINKGVPVTEPTGGQGRPPYPRYNSQW